MISPQQLIIIFSLVIIIAKVVIAEASPKEIGRIAQLNNETYQCYTNIALIPGGYTLSFNINPMQTYQNNLSIAVNVSEPGNDIRPSIVLANFVQQGRTGKQFLGFYRNRKLEIFLATEGGIIVKLDGTSGILNCRSYDDSILTPEN